MFAPLWRVAFLNFFFVLGLALPFPAPSEAIERQTSAVTKVVGAPWVDENGGTAEVSRNGDGTITIDGIIYGPPPNPPSCGAKGMTETYHRYCHEIEVSEFVCPPGEWRVIRTLRQCSPVVSTDPVLIE